MAIKPVGFVVRVISVFAITLALSVAVWWSLSRQSTILSPYDWFLKSSGVPVRCVHCGKGSRFTPLGGGAYECIDCGGINH